MSTDHERGFAVEIDAELRARIEIAAAGNGMTVKDYVAAVLREVLDSGTGRRSAEATEEWSRLSVPAFARDWDSDADAVYDDLA